MAHVLPNAGTLKRQAMPLASVNPAPRPFQQYVSDAPTGIKTTTKPAVVKLTRKSTRKFLKGNAIPAAYMLKPIEHEMVFFVARIYSIIRDLAFNYDRQHDDSFFEAYPQLLMLLPDEKSNPPDTATLRRDYRKYATRIAHYYYYYAQIRNKLTAVIINALNFTRFNGEDKSKDLATLSKWSKINTKTNKANEFPVSIGSIQAMLDAAKYAIGSNANGTTVMAMPLYDPSVYGNFGNHAGSLQQFATFLDQSKSLDTDPDTSLPFAAKVTKDGEVESDDFIRATNFYRNAENIVSQYYDLKSFDIINGSVLSVASGNDSNDFISLHLNRDGKTFKVNEKAEKSTSLTDINWENMDILFNILNSQFREMSDPTNDKTRFAIEQLKLFETPMKVNDMLAAVLASDFYDITSLRNCMKFATYGRPNTATIVRSNLPVADTRVRPGNADYNLPWEYQDSFWEGPEFEEVTTEYRTAIAKYNLERIPLYDDEGPIAWVRTAKQYPGLTPRVFPQAFAHFDDDVSKTPAPHVANAIAGDGCLVPNAGGFIKVGKPATLFDIATLSNLDPENTTIDFSSVDENDARTLVDVKEGFILYEDPSQPWVTASQFIDTTDPFACGFYLIMAQTTTANNDEYNDFVSRPQSFASFVQTKEAIAKATIATDAGDFTLPTTRLDTAGINNVLKMVNSVSYLNTLPHYSLLFIGDGLFVPPQARTILDSTALPSERSAAVTINANGAIGTNARTMADVIAAFTAAATVEKTAYHATGDKPSEIATKIRLVYDEQSPLNLMLHLFRQAVSIADPEIQQLLTAEDTYVDNPAFALASIFKKSISTGAAIRLYMFDPMYGPVPIIADTIPYDAGFGATPAPIDSSLWASMPHSDNLPDAKLGFTTLDAAHIDDISRRSLLDTDYTAHLWTWFLKGFSFNLAWLDEFARPTVSEKGPVHLDDSIAIRWPLEFFDQVSVSYAGFGDNHYFHDYEGIDQGTQPIQAATVSSYPKQTMVTEPKGTRGSKTRSDLPISGKDRSNKSFSTGAETSVYGMDKDDHTQKPSGSRRKQKRTFDKPKHRAPEKRPSKRGIDEEGTTLPKPAVGDFDSSSPSIDKAIDAKSKRKVNDTELMQS